MHDALWIVHGLAALIFLSAGETKLLVSDDVLMLMAPPSSVALRGSCGPLESPRDWSHLSDSSSFLRIRPGLTPLAAAGLVIIMIGATVVTLLGGQIVPASIPFTVGLLAVFVAYGRSEGRSRR